jgi:transcriptional regulator with XRE-family HTH domain
MTIGESKGRRMKDFRRARKTVDVSVGESVRILRELQELSQNDLAELTGIPQSTISAIENEKVNLGVERAKVIARALKWMGSWQGVSSLTGRCSRRPVRAILSREGFRRGRG